MNKEELKFFILTIVRYLTPSPTILLYPSKDVWIAGLPGGKNLSSLPGTGLYYSWKTVSKGISQGSVLVTVPFNISREWSGRGDKNVPSSNLMITPNMGEQCQLTCSGRELHSEPGQAGRSSTKFNRAYTQSCLYEGITIQARHSLAGEQLCWKGSGGLKRE